MITAPLTKTIDIYREKMGNIVRLHADQLNVILVEVHMYTGQMLMAGGFYLTKM